MARILVFDSGIGGISVLREIRKALPGSEFVYVADDAGFPYGDWEEGALCDRIVDLFAGLVDRCDPDIAVIACNTASTLVLPALRARFDIPFVGTVPAIKPAAEATRSGLVSILATPGTVKREYTFDLIARFAPEVAVTLVGSTKLATLAEAHIRGETVPVDSVFREVGPCFVTKDGRWTDTVVLACTHYPFLTQYFEEAAPWPVDWLDPAPAIARRVHQLLSELPAEASVSASSEKTRGTVLFTSEKVVEVQVASFLASHGL